MYMRPKHCHFISPFFEFYKLLYKLEERRRIKKANHYQHHHMSKHFFILPLVTVTKVTKEKGL